MAKNYIRMIAKERGLNSEELVAFLGAKNTSVQIDEDDPRIQQFIQQQHSASNQDSVVGLNATTEGELEYLSALRRNARFASLNARQFYKVELSRCHNLSTQDLIAEMQQSGDINEGDVNETVESNDDFFGMIRRSGNQQVAVLSLPPVNNLKVLTAQSSSELISVTKQELPLSDIDSQKTQQ
jgi:hypothetical protein